MKLSKEVKLYLFEKGGSFNKQKEVAIKLAVLAAEQYTVAVLTGEAGTTIGADLLTPSDLIAAFKEELEIITVIREQLSHQQYFNKLVAESYLTQYTAILNGCLDQLESESKPA